MSRPAVGSTGHDRAPSSGVKLPGHEADNSAYCRCQEWMEYTSTCPSDFTSSTGTSWLLFLYPPYSTSLLEVLLFAHLVTNLTALCRAQFTTARTKALFWIPSGVTLIHFTPSHSVTLRCFLILSPYTQLHLSIYIRCFRKHLRILHGYTVHQQDSC